MHAKLGTLSEEQLAAVEALTRGLVNKFLHPPMQALKQAARENDSTRVDALCETWSSPPRSAEREERVEGVGCSRSAPARKAIPGFASARTRPSAVGGK